MYENHCCGDIVLNTTAQALNFRGVEEEKENMNNTAVVILNTTVVVIFLGEKVYLKTQILSREDCG